MDTNIQNLHLDTIEQKRDFLRKCSNIVSELVEAGEYETINEAVIDVFYKSNQHTTFKTFNDWKAEGFSIKKGSKAFIVWGKPKPLSVKVEQPKDAPEQDSDEPQKEKDFFPLAFLFSNAQVERKGDKK